MHTILTTQSMLSAVKPNDYPKGQSPGEETKDKNRLSDMSDSTCEM